MDHAPAHARLLESLAALDKPVVTVLFGNPYAAGSFSRAPALLLAYETCDASELAAARALLGEAPIGGRLPITLPGLFEFGHGLKRDRR
jgi:beta-N-acetylhexosaminidase